MSASRLSTWAWIDTSSAATDSSRISTCGSAARARAIATRWRCPPDSALGSARACRSSRPTSPVSSLDPLPAPVGRPAVVQPQHLVDGRLGGLPRVQAGVRVLEDDLDLAAAPPPLAAPTWPGADRSRPQAVIVPAGRAFEADDHPGDRGLARPGLADDRQRPACGTAKLTSSTATRSPNSLRSPVTSRTGVSWRQSGLAQSVRHAGQAPAQLRRAGAPGQPAVQLDQLRQRRPGRPARRAGTGARTRTPRPAPRTPTAAGRGSRASRCAVLSMSGRAAASAAVYGCSGSECSSADSRTSTIWPGVHHRGPVADRGGQVQVVGDEQHRQAVTRGAGRPGSPSPRPGW